MKWKGWYGTKQWKWYSNFLREVMPQCSCCGSQERLLVHHIEEINRDNHPANLMVLCFKCHFAMDGRFRDYIMSSQNYNPFTGR